jgi:hypothetical protein
MDTDLREVAFFGKITAAFTHEMKNVLAIMKESAGLMDDLLSLSQNAAFPHKERLIRALETMEKQAKRGIELSSRLNRFAHSADEPFATLDLPEILEQIISLSERFARLKQVTLTLNPPEKAVSVVLPPMRLQMAIFACLEWCWGLLTPGESICLSCGQSGKEAIIRFTCQSSGNIEEAIAGSLSNSTAGKVMHEMAENLRGRIECDRSEPALELIVPTAG